MVQWKNVFCSPTGMYNNHDNDNVRASQLIVLMGKFLVHVVDLYQHCFSGTDAYYTDYCWTFLVATKPLWMVFSVCLSVCLPHYFHYVPTIVPSWNFQALLPMTKAKGPCKRSRSEVTGQTRHAAWWCFEEVPYCFSRSSVKLQGHMA